MRSTLLFAVASTVFVDFVAGQNIGTNTAEVHPALTVSSCTASGCTTSTKSIVLDSNWRWTHAAGAGNTTNCYTGNTWNAALCPDDATCAANCAIDGASYSSTYGITTSGNSLQINFVTQSSQANIGSRVYLLDTSSEYHLLQLLNQEFTFDVDVSNLPCGLNGALYFSEMAADGGMAAFPTNKAGAAYGTGYCDSQCPQDLKWINGAANVAGWISDTNDPNSGTGNFGVCCNEMDIWEANSISAAYTPHVCSHAGLYKCTGAECGNNPSSGRDSAPCDKDGCDFNSYRMGDKTFYGPGMTVDTTKVFTVVTQFITADGTNTGALSQIKRFYVQGGKIIPNSETNFPAYPNFQYNSISDAFCNDQKNITGDTNEFEILGGVGAMGGALSRGMVLVMSLWDDHSVNMLWLDSDYPTTADPTLPGIARGSCATTSGVPATVESQSPNAHVIFSNIKWGSINSTFSGTLTTTTAAPPTTTTTTTKPVSTTTTAAATTTTTAAGGVVTVTVTSTTTISSCVATTTTTSLHTTTTTTTTKPTTTTTTTTTTTAGNTNCASKWSQCGGFGWSGATCCTASTCTYSNPYYSQCL